MNQIVIIEMMKNTLNKESLFFPHFSRFISASYKVWIRLGFVGALIAGTLLFVGMNLWFSTQLPRAVHELLENETNQSVLIQALEKTNNVEVTQALNILLAKNDAGEGVALVAKDKNKIAGQISNIHNLIAQFPSYPDSYAYQSLLYFQVRDCIGAQKSIASAIAIDPNRVEFEKVKDFVSLCQ